MSGDVPINFFEELSELLDAIPFRPFSIVLMCGARYLVGDVDELVVYHTMYSYLPPKGGLVMFPFTQISCVEVDF